VACGSAHNVSPHDAFAKGDPRMTVHYWPAVTSAWERSRAILLRPVRLETWFGLGFTAWLAYIWSTAGLGGTKFRWNLTSGDLRDPLRAVESALSSAGHELLGAVTVMSVALLGLLVTLALAWVSSRGAFMYLDNVAHARARVTDPWHRFAALGDSLFLWRLLFLFAPLVVGAVLLVPVLALGLGGSLHGVVVVPLVLLGLLGGLLALVAMLLSFWTNQFVVPLMYRHGEGVLDAWRRFLPLLRAHLGSFLLYALFYLLLWIVAWVAVAVAGLLTCCVGLIIVSLPYLGTVLLLPLWVTERGMGPDFLAQFGPDWRIWPETDEATPADTTSPGMLPPPGEE